MHSLDKASQYKSLNPYPSIHPSNQPSILFLILTIHPFLLSYFLTIHPSIPFFFLIFLPTIHPFFKNFYHPSIPFFLIFFSFRHDGGFGGSARASYSASPCHHAVSEPSQRQDHFQCTLWPAKVQQHIFSSYPLAIYPPIQCIH